MFNRKYDRQRAKYGDAILNQCWSSLIRNLVAKYGILDGDLYSTVLDLTPKWGDDNLKNGYKS